MSQKKAQLLNPLNGNVNVTGVVTASSFVGDLTGDVTGNVSGSAGSATGNAGGLTGTPNIVVGSVTAASGAFSGNVSVGGTLTYQDVSHIDAVGIITAQQGIQVLANGLDITGVSTFKSDASIADKIIHTGDTNTAIRFPAADTFTVETDGSERLRVDSSGNIGINKDAPTSVLDVRQTNTGAATEIKLFNLDQSNATTQTAALVMTPDVRANGVKIIAVKEVADMSSTANKDLALTFQTVANNAAAERLRIDSNGNVLVAKTTTALDTAGSRVSSGFISLSGDSSSTNLAANAGGALSLANVDTTDGNFSNIGGYNSNGLVVNQINLINTSHSSRTGEITFSTHNGTSLLERLRIDSSGRALFNQALNKSAGGVAGSLLQVEAVDQTAAIRVTRNSASAEGPFLVFSKSRGTSINSNVVVQDDDKLGSIIFAGADGSDHQSGAASIQALVDGTPGSNDMPTRLVFSTTADGASSVTERLSITAGGGFHFTNGELIERAKVTNGKLSDNTDIDLENGMVYLFTTQETTTSTPNIRINSSTSLNSVMAVGETISVTLITTAAAAGYSAQLTIDGNAVTENWTGGSAPSDGGSSGVDIYAYTIIKTANATFTVVATQTKTS